LDIVIILCTSLADSHKETNNNDRCFGKSTTIGVQAGGPLCWEKQFFPAIAKFFGQQPAEENGKKQ